MAVVLGGRVYDIVDSGTLWKVSSNIDANWPIMALKEKEPIWNAKPEKERNPSGTTTTSSPVIFTAGRRAAAAGGGGGYLNEGNIDHSSEAPGKGNSAASTASPLASIINDGEKEPARRTRKEPAQYPSKKPLIIERARNQSDDVTPVQFYINEGDEVGLNRTLSLLRQYSSPYRLGEKSENKKNDLLRRFASVRHFKRSITIDQIRMATGGTSERMDKEKTVPSTFLRQDSIIIKIKPGQCFSEFANIVVETPARCDPRLGTLGELRHHLRTGTKSQVKKFLRQNNWSSGHRIRAELWKELCHDSNSDAQRAVYRDIVEKLGAVLANPSFTTAPGVVVCDHQLKENGRLCLLRLLTAVEHQRPDFTYVPVLYPLGALFLHYMNEEDAFACIMALISQSQKFLMQTDIATAASKRTMLVLMKKHVNRAYVLCKRLTGVEEDKYLVPMFDEWKSWIFRDLPFSHLVRVVDCFLFEGHKVLFRVALAILTLWSRDMGKLMQTNKKYSIREVGNEISEYCRKIKVQPTQLLKTAFGIRNLKMSVVRRLQEKHELVVRRSSMGVLEVQNVRQSISPHHYIDTRFDSSILDQNQALRLISWIPSRYQLHTPTKLFSTNEDGTSFTRLWTNLESWYPTIIIIRTSAQEVFGAYCSASWDTWKRQSGVSYFGTGETFLFRFPASVAEGEMFPWVGTKKAQVGRGEEMFQAADISSLMVGGGNGEGLCIRQSLESGSSVPCQTFDNPMLSRQRDFQIEALEVFGFKSDQ